MSDYMLSRGILKDCAPQQEAAQQNTTSAPKYTREELVKIIENSTRYTEWWDGEAASVIAGLEKAGALQVKQTELHDDPDLQGKI